LRRKKRFKEKNKQMDIGGSSSNGWRRFCQPQNLASTLGMATAASAGGGIVVPWRTSDRFDNL
jgi:hypothetical protein